MPKQLQLEDLKVESFTTSLTPQQQHAVRGGISGWICPPTYVCATRECSDENATCTQGTFNLFCYHESLCGWTNC